MSDTFDPYKKWLAIPPSEQPPNHYRLLGIPLFEDDADAIEAAANRQMMFIKQFGTGPHSDASQKILNELSTARLTLLNAEKKVAYDAKLKKKQQPVEEPAPPPAPAIEIQADPSQSIVERSKKKSHSASIIAIVVAFVLINFGLYKYFSKPAVKTIEHLVATATSEQPADQTDTEQDPDDNPVGVESQPSDSPQSSENQVPPPTKTTTDEPDSIAVASVPNQPIDLLKQIDLERDIISGDWQMDNGVLVGPAERSARVQLPCTIPDEYILTVEAEAELKLNRKPYFALGLVSGSHQFAVFFSDTHSITNLRALDGSDASVNETSYRGTVFTPGEPNTIFCIVKKKSIHVTVDGKEIINWDGDQSRLSGVEKWTVPDKRVMFIGCHNSSFRISHIEIQSLIESESEIPKPINLLTRIDPARDKVYGNFLLIDGILSWDNEEKSRLQFPVEIPQEYDLVVTAKRDGDDGMVIGLPVFGHQTLVALDYRYGSGLHLLDGESYHLNKSLNPQKGLFQPGKESTIVCSVRKSSIKVTFDGKPLIEWSGDPASLSLEERWEVSNTRAAFLGGDAGYSISKLELRPIDSSEVIPEPVPTPPETITVTTVEKSPIPDKAAIEKAEAIVQEIFADDLAAAKKPEQKFELAKKLLQQAIKTRNDPATKYVLLRDARDLSTDAGISTTALSAVDELAREFEIDLWEQRELVMKEAEVHARQPGQNQFFAESALELVEKAVNVGRMDLAVEFVNSAMSAARKAKIKELTAKVFELRTRILDLRKQLDVAQKAAETLKENPDDPAANFSWGTHQCLHENDWATGLPLLTKSDDPKLVQAVELDLANPTTAKEQMKVGDAWYNWVESSKKKESKRFLAAVVFWYTKALPGLANLEKLKVQKRLKVLDEVGFIRSESSSSSASNSSSGSSLFRNTYNATVEQKAAEWALRVGGLVTVSINGKETEVKSRSDLPSKSFVVTKLIFNKPSYSTGVNDKFTGDDMKVLAKLSGIKTLLIGWTAIGDIGVSHVQNLTTLEELVFGGCKVSDEGMKYLSRLKNLKILRVTYSSAITGKSLVHIKDLTNLETLSVGATHVDDIGMSFLKGLTKLTKLHLYDSYVGDEGLKHLHGMKNLRSIDIYRAKNTKEGIEAYRAQWKALQD